MRCTTDIPNHTERPTRKRMNTSPHKYTEPGPSGKPWQRCSILRVPKTQVVSLDDAPGLFENVGHGFSVYVLGRIPIDKFEGQKLSNLMSAALPEGTARGTVVQLLQIIDPHAPLCDERIPTLVLIIWGRAPADKSNSVEEYVIGKIQDMETEAGKLTDGEELADEHVFTYSKLLASRLIRQSAQAAQGFRGRLAATMLRASGMNYSTDRMFISDGTQLSCLVEVATCDIYSEKDHAVLLNDYNRPGGYCGCVYNGPSRGAVLYTSNSKNENHHTGGPTSGKCTLFDDECYSETFEQCISKAVSKFKSDVIPGCVTMGGHLSNTTQLMSYAMFDDSMTIPEWSEYSGLKGYKVVHCKTVATVLPSPLNKENRMLYGCIQTDISTLLDHKHPEEQDITILNTKDNRESLIRRAPGKQGFRLMNAQTAVLDELGGSVLSWKVPCSLFETA